MRRRGKHEDNPQSAKLKDGIITVTNKNGWRQTVCKYTITIEEWMAAKTHFGNSNWWVRELVKRKFFESYPREPDLSDMCFIERIIDYQICEIEKELTK